ncbi:Uncharacterised protein [Mycolicibacterium vanbaalenii]|uniref:Uncharacterized protein n=1 Tax=Mycolicibacterium vanbaalenii TaxID=110539 RepID=A0A5S9R6D7_MYCVN|nr:hypothetical protein [Mycolicibacterium vanbaalenii]CAA0130017.1 Uncharacterised protein [Mycolicibacterium vanbaalenii]
MMIRWYDDPWDDTFWRRCECAASIQTAVCPVKSMDVVYDVVV